MSKKQSPVEKAVKILKDAKEENLARILESVAHLPEVLDDDAGAALAEAFLGITDQLSKPMDTPDALAEYRVPQQSAEGKP